MKHELVIVSPVGGGWAIHSSFSDLPLLFLSGAAAEETAKTLAGRIAAFGQPVRVEVHDRRDDLIANLDFCATP